MGMFDFLKKIFNEKENVAVTSEKLGFSELGDWLEGKINEGEIKEKEIFVVIRDKIGKFGREFREKMVVLRGVDVEAKKGRDDLKEIVNNGRRDYIALVEVFLDTLESLEMNNLEQVMEKINKAFLDFDKSSYKNYERTTILIGKEMGSMKDGLKIFSKELIRFFEDSKVVMNYYKRIFLIQSKFEMISSVDKTLEKISETLISINKKINSHEEENKKFTEEMVNVKKSSDYLDILEVRKKLESLDDELKKDIFGLKQLLDFKALANFFHINEEQLKIVKKHKENFHLNFQYNDGKKIVDLLDEAKLNNDIISGKVSQIRIKKDKIVKMHGEIGKDETKKLSLQIDEEVLRINNLNEEKVKEEKRGEKLRGSREEMIIEMKDELGKMNVEFS
jgi:hypothetical protein